MVREETVEVLKTISVAYPNYKSVDKTATLNLWTEMLKEYEFRDVLIALKTYIATDTSGFAPSVSQLIALINQTSSNENDMSEAEAWDLISKATADGYYHPKERFNELPDILKKVVGSPVQLKEWSMLQKSEFQTVVCSNVKKDYRTELARSKQLKAMPSEVRQAIESRAKLKAIESEDN